MGSNPTLSARVLLNGEVLEWPNRRDWKSRVPSQGEPWVRIPPSPPHFGKVLIDAKVNVDGEDSLSSG